MKTKIDIISGSLGAGKTTLIKKLIREAYHGEKLVIVQNECGAETFSAQELGTAGIDLEGVSAGCICCDGSANFISSIESIVAWTQPERILLEPSGLGRLSDIKAMLRSACGEYTEISGTAVVADARKAELYLRNFRGVYDDQIANAACIVLSRAEALDPELLEKRITLLKTMNPGARVIYGAWNGIPGGEIAEAMKCRAEI